MTTADTIEHLERLPPAALALLWRWCNGHGHPGEDTIAPRSGSAPPPLSYAQRRLWFIEQLQPGTTVYHLPLVVPFGPDLDAAILARCIEALWHRHEALRTTFVMIGDEPVQRIDDGPFPGLRSADCSSAEAAARAIAAEIDLPFDLEQGPLVRACLVRAGAERWFLVLTMHHLVSDGWSLGLLERELDALYGALARGLPSPLPEPAIQYADFAVWQHAELQGARLTALTSYWIRCLRGAPPVTDLPADRPRPVLETYQGAYQNAAVSEAVTGRLERLAQDSGATLFMVLLAGFQALLYRYSGQDDLVIGSPIANRNRAELEGVVGLFVNMLPLRTRLDGTLDFAALIARVRQVSEGAYEHQDLPFEVLVDELAPPRSLAHHPMFQVVFALQNTPMDRTAAAAAPGASGVTPVLRQDDSDMPRASRRFVGEGATRELAVASERGATHPPERLGECRQNLPVAGLVPAKFELSVSLRHDGGRLVGSWEYRTDLFEHATIARLADDYHQLLDAWSAQPALPLADVPLAAAPAPEPGPEAPPESWSQRMAEHARCAPDAVAVAVSERAYTYRELAALAAEARARAPAPPHAARPVDATDAVALVTELWVAAQDGVPLWLADSSLDGDAAMILAAAPAAPSAQWLGFAPPALDRAAHAAAADMDLGPGARLLQLRTPKGSPALLGALAATWAGATWCGALTVADGELPHEAIGAAAPTHLVACPALLARLDPADVPTVTCAVAVGQPLFAAAATPWARAARLVCAWYVPAAGLWSVRGGTDPGTGLGSPGWPMPGLAIEVVDERGRLVPAGAIGELVFRGWCVPGAVSTASARAPRRSSGLLGRRRPDGAFELICPRRRLARIRGMLADPERAAAWARQHPAVAEAAVEVHERPTGLAELVLRIRPRPDRRLLPVELAQALGEQLGAALRPDRVLVGDDLAAAGTAETGTHADAPDPIEAVLIRIWSSVLAVPRVGVDDDFFLLGGNSLSSVQIIARMRAALAVDVPLHRLFDAPTIQSMAAVVRELQATGAASAAPVVRVRSVREEILRELGIDWERLSEAEIPALVAGLDDAEVDALLADLLGTGAA